MKKHECNVCRQLVSDLDTECPNCGNYPDSWECTGCGKIHDADSGRCADCGWEVAWDELMCEKCGHPLETKYSVCPDCDHQRTLKIPQEELCPECGMIYADHCCNCGYIPGTVECTYCGKRTPESNLSCLQCGKAIEVNLGHLGLKEKRTIAFLWKVVISIYVVLFVVWLIWGVALTDIIVNRIVRVVY